MSEDPKQSGNGDESIWDYTPEEFARLPVEKRAELLEAVSEDETFRAEGQEGLEALQERLRPYLQALDSVPVGQ